MVAEGWTLADLRQRRMVVEVVDTRDTPQQRYCRRPRVVVVRHHRPGIHRALRWPDIHAADHCWHPDLAMSEVVVVPKTSKAVGAAEVLVKMPERHTPAEAHSFRTGDEVAVASFGHADTDDVGAAWGHHSDTSVRRRRTRLQDSTVVVVAAVVG